MVRGERVKQYTFASQTVNGSVFTPNYSTHAINGEVLKIRFEGINSPGSLWIGFSGNNIELFRKNDFASGTSAFELYPQAYIVDQTNTTGSPNLATNLVINEPIYWAGSGFTSGTGTTFGPINVFYR